MKWILIFLLSFPVVANDFYVRAGAPICTSLTALGVYEAARLGIGTTNTEKTTLRNECDFRPYRVKVFIHIDDTYSKAQAMNYKGKRKVYFVNNRDLERVE